MNTTVSTPNRYSIEKFAVPFTESGRPAADQVPIWLDHGTCARRSAAHRMALAMENRGVHSRVVDTATGEIVSSTAQIRARRDAGLHQLARDITPIPASVAGIPNGYAWATAVGETYRRLLAA